MSRPSYKRFVVWFCDYCNFGPLNLSRDTHCANCSHQRCAYCRTESIKSLGSLSPVRTKGTPEATTHDSEVVQAGTSGQGYGTSNTDEVQGAQVLPAVPERGSDPHEHRGALQAEQQISEGLRNLQISVQISDGTDSSDHQGHDSRSEVGSDSGVSSPIHQDSEFEGAEFMDLEAIEKDYSGSVNNESDTQQRPDLIPPANDLQKLNSSALRKELADNGSPKEPYGRPEGEVHKLETSYHANIQGHKSPEDVQDHGVDHKCEDSQAIEPVATQKSPEQSDQLHDKDNREWLLRLSASEGQLRASVLQANEADVEVAGDYGDSDTKTISDSTSDARVGEPLEPLLGSSESHLRMSSTDKTEIGPQIFQTSTFQTETGAEDPEVVNQRSVSVSGQEWTTELPYRQHGLASIHRWLGTEDISISGRHGALDSEVAMSSYKPLLLTTGDSESDLDTVEAPKPPSPTLINAEKSYDSDDMSNESIPSLYSARISMASSSSSVSVELGARVFKELRDLFINHEVLRPLYDIAVLKTGPDRFQRNIRRLLLGYSRSLRKEAKQPTELEAARLVRRAARNLSSQIASHVTDKNESLQWKDKLPESEEDFSEDELEPDDADETLYTLEKVKSFMVSSIAFSELCHGLRVWLKIEEIPSELVPSPDNGASQEKVEVLTKPLGTSADQPSVELTAEENTRLASSKNISMPNSLQHFAARSVWFRIAKLLQQQCWNMISDMLQPKVSAGHVRISWTCRCGDRLRLEVHESRLQAATAFVKQAAGSNAGTVTTRRRIEGSSASASSSSQASTSTDAPAANSPSSGPHSPDTSPSDEEAETVTPPFIPTGAKKYLLLCVNTASLHGIGQRKLVNVDVTNIEDDGELFQALRNAYTTLSQTSWNPFLIPKTMHYVKFQLIFLQKSGELVGHYEVDSIPSLKQVSKQEYAFWPCPPDMGELPISPDLFMHAFLDPGNHMGTLAVQRLPKKLWAELRWNGQVHGHFNIPTGWGIYIVEGVYWALVWWWTILALVAVTILTVAWSALMDDVQGGTGLGQYCLAALAGLGSVCLWHYNARET